MATESKIQYFDTINECEIYCHAYKIFMKRYIDLAMKDINDNERVYLDFDNSANFIKNFCKYNNTIVYGLSAKWCNFLNCNNISKPIPFDVIHYLDLKKLPKDFKCPFQELQEEFIKHSIPILLIDESSKNSLIKYEIFICTSYLPRCIYPHGYNFIKSIPEHMDVYDSFYKPKKYSYGTLCRKMTQNNLFDIPQVSKEMYSLDDDIPDLISDSDSDSDSEINSIQKSLIDNAQIKINKEKQSSDKYSDSSDDDMPELIDNIDVNPIHKTIIDNALLRSHNTLSSEPLADYTLIKRSFQINEDSIDLNEKNSTMPIEEVK